jgi:hypothetical protein
MATDGRSEFRRIADRIVETFIDSVEQRHGRGPVGGSELRAVAGSPENLAGIRRLIDSVYPQLMEVFSDDLLRRQRTDPFRRLIIHPLSDDFEAGHLSRDLLPNFFSFVHLVMGDQIAALSARCSDIWSDIQANEPSEASWDDFYQDPRAEQVMWAILVRIAESFRRFEARRDWFIGLMQYKPQSVALGTNMFIPRATGGDRTPEQFGQKEFNILFSSLFRPMRDLSKEQRARFEHDFDRPPAKVFDSLWECLESNGAPL